MPNSLTHRMMSILVVAAVVLAGGCTQMDAKRVLEVTRPKASVDSVRLTGLDFDKVDITFDVMVDNPNPVSLQLAGLDYNLQLAGQPFVTGTQDKGMSIAASGASHVAVPLSLAFKDIYNAIDALKGEESVPYEVDLGLNIVVPLLGSIRYPLTHSGEFPVPRVPAIALTGMRVEQLNLSGAKIALQFEVDNPNGFSLAIDKLAYDLMVNGKRWANSEAVGLGNIGTHGKGNVTLPVNLSFSELGMGLYTALSGGSDLQYSLSGTLDATSSNALLGSFKLPIDSKGAVALTH